MARMFFQDMEEAGIFMGDLDPNHLADGTKEIDIDALAPILHTVAQFPNIFSDPNRLSGLKQLDQEYQSGFIGQDWPERTARALKSAVSECAEHPVLSREIFRGNYNRFALDHYRFYDGKPLPEFGISQDISAPIRQDIEFAHTTDELDVALHSMYEAVTQMGDNIDFAPGVDGAAQVRSFKTYMEAYFQNRDKEPRNFSTRIPGEPGMVNCTMPATPADRQRMQKARAKAMEFCGLLEANPTARNKQLAGIYDARKTARFSGEYRLEARVEDAKKVSGYLEKQNESIENLRGLWAKMQAEDKGKHKNSPEYQNMYDAVEFAVEVAATYNMDDPESVRQFQGAMDSVRSSSTAYVNAKVVGKSKATTMGIERKNTALALLQMSDPEKFSEIAPKVKDLRESKAKKHTDLRSLISEEKKEARKRISTDPEKEERKHVRRQREHARQKQRDARTV